MRTQTRKRPPKEFAGVRLDVTGEPVNVGSTRENYDAYLNWLGDYLYRSSEYMPESAILSVGAAWPAVSYIESEIASWIWEHPFDDYPPDNYQPRHADILHRVQLSRILSRVPVHDDRRVLLHRFYRELDVDSHK